MLLAFFCHFYILKVLFLSIFCRYFRYFVGTNDMLMVWRYIKTLVYRQSTNIVKIYVYASERARKFWHIYILKVLFLSIVVGTSDILSVQMICLWYGAIYKR